MEWRLSYFHIIMFSHSQYPQCVAFSHPLLHSSSHNVPKYVLHVVYQGSFGDDTITLSHFCIPKLSHSHTLTLFVDQNLMSIDSAQVVWNSQ